ncbi:MAG: hypothetical protein KDD38_04470 [Bdellovibrionales bacterium]|nr:hypothetical protein [Bdellovibrionales bacterium]
MNSLIKWLVPSLMFTPLAMAEPTLYPSNLNVLSNIHNTTNSNIMADEVDDKTVWVLPPNTAGAVVKGLHSKTANMGFCAEMRDLKDYSRELSKDIRTITKKRNEMQERLTGLQTRADLMRENAESFAADKNLTVLVELDARILSAESRLTELYGLSETCTQDCDEISKEIKSIVAEKTVMMKDRSQITRQNTADIRQYTKLKKEADAATLTYKNAKESFMELVNELSTVQSRFRATFASFGQMEGARAAITYSSSWDSNINALREKNPGINFAKMATHSAILMTEISGIQDIDPQGAIKSFGLGGHVQNGVASFTAYPESLDTNVVLSLIGACPMEHPEYFDLVSSDVQDMQYGVIITYDYDSLFTAKAEAKYNMYKMYQKIMRSGKSGGLFRSKSWSSVEERNFFKDSFTVSWDDSENTLSQADKDAREQEMRRSVLSRLATIALPTVPNRAEILNAGDPPTRGAIVVSDELMKTCPSNVYCVAGAAVMRVLDAIFGNSTSTANYTNIQDITVTEKYNNKQKITKSWITSYLKL